MAFFDAKSRRKCRFGFCGILPYFMSPCFFFLQTNREFLNKFSGGGGGNSPFFF